MKILVTGAAGYKGTQLIDLLLEQKHQVVAVDNFMYSQKVFQRHLKNPAFEVLKSDIRNLKSYEGALKSADVFIPLACLTGAPICQKYPDLATAINHESILSALEQLSASQYVLFPMTNSGYGVGEQSHFCDEKSPLKPLSHYAKLKVETEQAVLSRQHSMSFRFATLFGVSDRMRYDLLVNDFMWRAQTEKCIQLFEGHFRRNFLHVTDAARVYLHALNNLDSMNGNIFNVGLTSANMTKKELCLAIQKIVPEFKIVEDESQKDPDQRDYVVSNEKIESTGFSCLYDLQTGLLELKKAFYLGKSLADSNTSGVEVLQNAF